MRLQLDPQHEPASESGWRRTWFDIIYRHDTRMARNFDLLLIVAILASVLVIMVDSVASIHARHAGLLYRLEWGFTLLFSVEYLMRLIVVRHPLRYALSLWGVIDLLSILPTYMSLLLPRSQSLLAVRVLRMLRLFRVLKLTQYVEEGSVLIGALVRSRRKILLFLSALVTIAVVFGALMYVVEGPHHGFTDIPTSIYWAIVTMATVGFGDIAPQSALGRFITSLLILIGYSIIAVPTGIYTAELASGLRREDHADHRVCGECGQQGHDPLAGYCLRCGQPLPPPGG